MIGVVFGYIGVVDCGALLVDEVEGLVVASFIDGIGQLVDVGVEKLGAFFYFILEKQHKRI